MPHTSHKKGRGGRKRHEVMDDAGWTRISTSHSTRQTYRPSPLPHGTETASHPGGGELTSASPLAAPPISPMRPTAGTTLESMLAQYRTIEAKFVDTEFHRVLEDVLVHWVLRGACGPISNCVLVGSGSLCGDAVQWIDRHDSAYYQVAAFRAVVETIEKVQGQRPRCYGQEPYYNDLDAAFLAALAITKLDHPAAFDVLDCDSFVYSPAAERHVESHIMLCDPLVWLHRPLDDREQNVEQSVLAPAPTHTENPSVPDASPRFPDSYDWIKLPDVSVKHYPFHQSVLWWRKRPDGESTP